jgi:hypothetical protein
MTGRDERRPQQPAHIIGHEGGLARLRGLIDPIPHGCDRSRRIPSLPSRMV